MTEDEDAIVAVLVRYATAIDTRDWALLRSCFTPDVVADYTDIGSWDGADPLLDFMVEAHAGLSASQHRMSNFVIEVDGPARHGGHLRPRRERPGHQPRRLGRHRRPLRGRADEGVRRMAHRAPHLPVHPHDGQPVARPRGPGMSGERLAVVQWTTGNVARQTVRAVLGRHDLELVGAFAHSASKAGSDVAELCGLASPTGVVASERRRGAARARARTASSTRRCTSTWTRSARSCGRAPTS